MRKVWPLLFAVAVFYLAATTWIAGDRTASQHVYDSYSTMSTAGEGLSLAYAYLQRQQRHVSMMTHPIGTVPIAANGVVFRVGATPTLTLEEAEEKITDSKKAAIPLLRPEEYAFVARGGRIILAVPGNLVPLEFRYDAAPTAESVFPFAANVRQIAIAPRRGIAAHSLLPRMVALYAAGPRVAVARESIGRGDLIVVADPEIFTNDQLRAGHHLPFLLALCGGPARPLLFDETVHGLSGNDGPLAMLQDWNLGPFLALLLGVAALIVWRGSTRVGAPEDSYRETRSDAVDLVDSLGALYEHSMTEIEALRFYHEALVRQVAAQSGLRGDALHRRVGDLTGRARSLAAINKAFEKLKETGARHAKHS